MANTYRRILRRVSKLTLLGCAFRKRNASPAVSRAPRVLREARTIALTRPHRRLGTKIFIKPSLATDEDADIFRGVVDGERMHPSEKGGQTLVHVAKRNVQAEKGLTLRSCACPRGVPGLTASPIVLQCDRVRPCFYSGIFEQPWASLV